MFNVHRQFDALLALLPLAQATALADRYNDAQHSGATREEAIADTLLVHCMVEPGEDGCPYGYVPVEVPGIAEFLRDELLEQLAERAALQAEVEQAEHHAGWYA